MENTAFFGRRGKTMFVVTLLLCPAVFGCSSSDRLKKQVAGLESQITALRADQDRLEERLAAVELSAAAPRVSAAPTADRVERPRLKVIHLAPEDAESSAEPVEPSPPTSADAAGRRPVIRGTGDRVIKVGDGDSDESTRRDEPATRPVAELGRDARGN